MIITKNHYKNPRHQRVKPKGYSFWEQEEIHADTKTRKITAEIRKVICILSEQETIDMINKF